MKGLYKIGGAILISLGIVFSAITYSERNDKPEYSKALPENTIKIAVSTTPLSAPFYIAKAKGFFHTSGVNVELIEMAGGNKCFQALLDEKADLATTSNSVIMFNAFKHNNYEVISSFVESDNDIKIITNKKPEITSPYDLIGKTVGIVKGSASEYFLHTWLTVSGVDPNLVNTAAYNVNEMPAALKNREIDAISVWEPFAFKASQLNTSTQIMDTKGLYNLSFNLVGLKDNSTDQNSSAQDAQHAKILEALNKAVHFIAINPEDSQLILRRNLKLSQDFIDWIWQDYLFKLSLNHSLISSLENQARWAIESGLVEKTTPPDFNNLISPQALNTISDNASLQQ